MLPDDNGPWVKYEDAEQAHRDATEEVAKAHKRGWEQAKMKAVIALGGCNTVEECWDAIAAMEYGGEAND